MATFKHFFNSGTIGSGTIKFRHFSQTEPLPQLATPQNVTASGTTVSWDEVANAKSYDVLVDGEVWENVPQPSGGVVIKAGTYQFIEEPIVPIGTNIDENITATINTLIDNDVYGNQKTTTGIAAYRLSSAEMGGIIIYNEEPYYFIDAYSWQYTNEDGDVFDATTDSSKLRTIVIATDQTVSNELYKWAITDGNLVKLS